MENILKNAIDDNNFKLFQSILENEESVECTHCYCRNNNYKHCAYLLDYAIQQNKKEFIDCMIVLSFPSTESCLTYSAHRNDIDQMRKLYAYGVRFKNIFNDIFEFHQHVTLDTIKVSILECEYPIYENFRKVVEHSSDDILNWVYDYLSSLIDDGSDTKDRYGWGCYEAALYKGTFERFIFLVEQNIPFYPSDLHSFWDNLLCKNTRTNFYYTNIWQQEWRVKQRQKILKWCIDNDFQLTTEALINAIENEKHDLIELLIQKNTWIDHRVMSIIMPIYSIDKCKGFYALGIKQREEQNDEERYLPLLSKNILFDIGGNMDVDEEKLNWLIDDIKCPIPQNLMAELIQSAPKSRLDWFYDKKKVFPTMLCWSSLSERENSINEMLFWLKEKQCPLDEDVLDHMGLRQNTFIINDFVEMLKQGKYPTWDEE